MAANKRRGIQLHEPCSASPQGNVPLSQACLSPRALQLCEQPRVRVLEVALHRVVDALQTAGQSEGRVLWGMVGSAGTCAMQPCQTRFWATTCALPFAGTPCPTAHRRAAVVLALQLGHSVVNGGLEI